MPDMLSDGRVCQRSHIQGRSGAPLRHPGLVPWDNLGPGDIVEIYWRAEPYRSKWVMSRQGTAQQPIIVRGIPVQMATCRSGCHRASVPSGLSYWSHGRGVIKIGASNNSGGQPAMHIVIENLDIHGPTGEFLPGARWTDRVRQAGVSGLYGERSFSDTLAVGCTTPETGSSSLPIAKRS